MKNNGFTLVEVLAVVVIISILSGMAMIGVTRYRTEANEKDLLNLHSSLETAYDNYRSNTILDGDDGLSDIIIGSGSSFFDKYIEGLSYDGEKLSIADLGGTEIHLVNKAGLLSNSDYTTGRNDQDFIKDGACLVDSEVDAANEIEKKCKTDESGNRIPSNEDLICIKVKYKDTILIDDYKQDNDKSDYVAFNKLCKYLGNYGK